MNSNDENEIYQEMTKRNKLTPRDLLAIAKRRSKIMFWSGAIVLVIAITSALFWPPTYESTATILIEEQDIPKDLVRSTITSYAVQRIEEIRQRITTIGNIMSIVERFNLYSESELRRMTRTEIAEEFRDNVAIRPISAEVIDPQSGRPTEAVIAFSLAFKGDTPDIAHKVTNELVTLYLNENLRERTEQSTSTSEFLSTEAASLSGQLQQLEREIADFKQNNSGSLPELQSFNLSIVDRTERELVDTRTRIQQLEKNKMELAAKIIQLSPTAPKILPSGETVLGDADLLKAMQSEYRKKSSIYRPEHPDLIRLKRAIEELVAQIGPAETQKDIVKQLQQVRQQLSQARLAYSENHPEVQELQRQLSTLQSQLAETPLENEIEIVADNPTYILLNTQLAQTDAEIAALKVKQAELQEKITKHEEFLLQAPAVEKDYAILLRDRDNTQLKYREIKAKLMEAELAKNLEAERKGERFTLIQPPEIPEEPISPDRIVVAVLGIFLAIGASIGSSALFEAIDPALYGEKAVTLALAMAPLVAIPYMPSEGETRNRRHRFYWTLAGTLLFCITVIFLFHNFVKPLDVTWYILTRKLGF